MLFLLHNTHIEVEKNNMEMPFECFLTRNGGEKEWNNLLKDPSKVQHCLLSQLSCIFVYPAELKCPACQTECFYIGAMYVYRLGTWGA